MTVSSCEQSDNVVRPPLSFQSSNAHHIPYCASVHIKVDLASEAKMNGYATANSQPPAAMFVRALYKYDAGDDQTSLSFRRGDVIQVITQLESGWWDGVLNGRRGWFPSNYCQVVTDSSEDLMTTSGEADEPDSQDEGQEEYEDLEYEEVDTEAQIREEETPSLQRVETNDPEPEEAAFWIPQATPEGRLYYYNTLTGVSKMELPLEQLSTANDTGPRDRNHIYMPDMTRPPPERMAAGYEREDDTDYENSGDDIPQTSWKNGELDAERRRPKLQPAFTEAYNHAIQSAMKPNEVASTSFTGPVGTLSTPSMPRQLFDDGQVVPLTWLSLLQDFHKAVERFRYSVEMAHRSDIVRRAEDISDHLRLLLAAGSGTTDNHSGNPSIISSNKALYPLFRETMSRFSKLVLSSHIAAADYPPLDAHAKCLKEADGMLHAVYGFVEVARQQRGEEIPRLIPGFVTGSNLGGGWRNNGLSATDNNPNIPLGEQDDYDNIAEPNARLDYKFLERLDELQRMIEQSTKRLNEQLVLHDKLITPMRHKLISDSICKAGGKVMEIYRPFISTIESVNLNPIGVDATDPQIREYNTYKQKVYDQTSELLIACQAIASPLADEWAENRVDSLEDRMKTVSVVLKDLEICTSQLMSFVRLIADMMPMEELMLRDERKVDSAVAYANRERSTSNSSRRGYDDSMLPPEAVRSGGGTAKLEKIFGEVPAPLVQQPVVEDTPDFLRLDHENEITYDMKSSPPGLRGGTLVALVEQLTRHDRLDSDFNNTFLLTYRSFTNASELFELLVKRWGIQPPYGLSQEDYQTWVDKKQKPIQFRVVNILKNWFDTYWMEGTDEDAKRLMERVLTFAKEHVATTNTPGAAPLMTSVEQRLSGSGPSTKRLVLTLNQQTPTPILPKNMKRLKFLDIDPIEFGRQLTIIESKLYGKIKPMECLNKTWQKKLVPGEPDPAANIKEVILHSNQLTNWVAQMILNQADVRRRVVVIKHFVSVADVSERGSNTFICSKLTTFLEMPSTQQFLHSDINHLRFGYCSYPSSLTNLEPSKWQNKRHT
jgi:son of sevenless